MLSKSVKLSGDPGLMIGLRPVRESSVDDSWARLIRSSSDTENFSWGKGGSRDGHEDKVVGNKEGKS